MSKLEYYITTGLVIFLILLSILEAAFGDFTSATALTAVSIGIAAHVRIDLIEKGRK
jgi:hypothetical protein